MLKVVMGILRVLLVLPILSLAVLAFFLVPEYRSTRRMQTNFLNDPCGDMPPPEVSTEPTSHDVTEAEVEHV